VWQGGTYWSGGPWMGSYMFNADPANGVSTAQAPGLFNAAVLPSLSPPCNT